MRVSSVTRFVEHEGRKVPLAELADRAGVSRGVVWNRYVRQRWPLERALAPKRKRQTVCERDGYKQAAAMFVGGLQNEREFAAWAAGLFDGEGCIYIAPTKRTRRTYYRVDLLVTNTKRDLLLPLVAYFGGFIIDCAVEPDRLRKHIWKTTGTRHAEEVLRLIAPWLIGKRDEVVVALEACSLIGGIGERKSDQTLARLAELKRMMRPRAMEKERKRRFAAE